MTRVYEMTRPDLEARRAEILAELGLTRKELDEKAAAYSLVADEWSAWEEIREIEFLLVGD